MTTTWWRAPPAGIRQPAARPTAASVGPPVSTTRSVAIAPDVVLTPATRLPASLSPVNAVCSTTCTPAVNSAAV